MDDVKLDRVEIEGFRGIDRLAIDLDDLTTIIGEHDCGKSSLLRAIALVLDPGADAGEAPTFQESDFHRRLDSDAERARSLSITLGIGDRVIRVSGSRLDGATPRTTVAVLDAEGRPVDGADGPARLHELRREHPAIVVRRPRVTYGSVAEDESEHAPGLLPLILEAARPGAEITWDELAEVRDELADAAGTIAEQLSPAPRRHRSIRELTDTPRPLQTDLASALEPDAGRQRRVAALWLVLAILAALPPDGLAEDADPILLFDDIEANLHPTWLAALSSVAINLPFQEVISTHSSEVLAWMPLSSLRRLSRAGDAVDARAVRREAYSDDELRRLTFHVRLNRGGSFFARSWVLVEGETEAWLIPELARLAGVEFPVEGIRAIEFAQSGAGPLIKAAGDLGIPWLLLSDGDQAGKAYASAARDHVARGARGEVVLLPSRDIEHYLFRNGYAKVIRKAAGRIDSHSAGNLIGAAVHRIGKPGLALEILAEADRRGPEGVPPVLRHVAETAQAMARDTWVGPSQVDLS